MVVSSLKTKVLACFHVGGVRGPERGGGQVRQLYFPGDPPGMRLADWLPDSDAE